MLVSQQSMPELYCVRALPEGVAGAMATDGFAARVAQFGDDFEVADVGCYTVEQIEEKMGDPRLK